jgi:hypothetical protein
MDVPAALNRCTDEQLKRLFSLGLSADHSPSVLAVARAFQQPDPDLDSLAVQLGGGSLPQLAARVCETGASLSFLEFVKERSKEQRLLAKAPTLRDAATVVYHAAIAAAFASHGVTISARAISSRFGLYQDLAVVFADHPFGHIFQAAVDRMPFPDDAVR